MRTNGRRARGPIWAAPLHREDRTRGGREVSARERYDEWANEERVDDLKRALLDARAERDEAQRAKYGTPCRCESWIETCGKAEDERDAALALVSVLKAECLASREMDRVDNSETRTDSDMREAWATLKDRRAATDAAGVALDA